MSQKGLFSSDFGLIFEKENKGDLVFNTPRYKKLSLDEIATFAGKAEGQTSKHPI